jgi:muramoyltetrapeptide carboxypeptidase
MRVIVKNFISLCIYLFFYVSSMSNLYAAKSLSLIKPTELIPGDTVALISSGSPVDNVLIIQQAAERLQALGLKVKYGKYLYAKNGYLAGTDQERAADVNAMFADPNVKAIFEIRGGYGSSQILLYLNYKLIRQHPKIIMGYSDITALLLAIHAKTGLVTFHGPMPSQPWPQVTVNYVKAILFSNNAMILKNFSVAKSSDDLIQTKNIIYTINGGIASGPLLGGNLTVLTSLIGTPYQPDYHGAILFVEDVGEDVYRIDRMLTQLKNSGVLNQISGFIFGQCIGCGYGAATSYGSLTLQQVINKHIKPLHIPSWTGAMFGHQPNMYVLPEGLPCIINADKGTIQMVNPATKSDIQAE